MRVLALLFALAGAAGGGFMGFILLTELQKKEAEARAGNARIDEDGLKKVKLATYGMIAAIPIGVIGGYLAMNRKGLLAALMLAVAYATPFVILAATGLDLTDERVKPIFFFPAGLIIAAFLSLFIRPGVPYKKPRGPSDIPEDADLRG